MKERDKETGRRGNSSVGLFFFHHTSRCVQGPDLPGPFGEEQSLDLNRCAHLHACDPSCRKSTGSDEPLAGGGAAHQQEVTTIQWVAAAPFCPPDYRKWLCDGPDAADTLMGVSQEVRSGRREDVTGGGGRRSSLVSVVYFIFSFTSD